MTDDTDFMIEPHSPGDLYDRELAGRIGEKLNKHYPGHMWAVNVNSVDTARVVNIFDFAISQQYGYVLHLDTVENDPTLKCVIKAGGEILERANFARGQAKGEFAQHIDGAFDRHQPKSRLIQ